MTNIAKFAALLAGGLCVTAGSGFDRERSAAPQGVAPPQEAYAESPWFRDAVRELEARQLDIRHATESGGLWWPDHRNRLAFHYRPDGFHVEPLAGSGRVWDVDFEVLGAGRSESLQPFEPSEIDAAGSQAFARDGDVRVDYANSAEGMRQTFTIDTRPAGEGDVRVVLQTTSDLTLVVNAGAVEFEDAEGTPQLRYSDLRVWDADGTPVGSRMEDLGGGQFALVACDVGATYPLTIDPLSATPDWTADPTDTDTTFGGWKVAGLGDVNGDGFSDVVIGSVGTVYVYHGSATGLPATATWTEAEPQANSGFGYHGLSSAGDVNADGFSDLIVGAPYWDSAFANEGQAYVYLGSATGLPAAADVTLTPTGQADARFGHICICAGDTDHDGDSEVAVSAPFWDSSSFAGEGRVYLFLGASTGLDATADFTRDPTDRVDASFGHMLVGVNDTNADGFSDFVVGGTLATGLTLFEYHGASGGLNTTFETQITTNFNGDGVGAGDINGDGFGDIVVGDAGWSSVDVANEGRLSLFLGGTNGLSTTATQSVDPTNQSLSGFGYSVAGLGDVDGDGFADVMVSAVYYDTGTTNEGRAYAYHGGPSGLRTDNVWTNDPTDQTDAWFGWSVAAAGDVNGDGLSDAIIGAPYFDTSGHTTDGRAYVYYGLRSATLGAGVAEDPTNQTNSYFGFSVAGVGDLNGDGFTDVAIGAPEYNGTSGNEGRVYAYFGSATGLPTTPSKQFHSSTQQNAYFGYSVAGAGDVDGDGFADLLVGAPGIDAGGLTNSGKAFLFRGATGTTMDNTFDWGFTSPAQANAEFGTTVSGAGDVNGDGFADIMVAAPKWNGTDDEGQVWIYLNFDLGTPTTITLDPTNQVDANFGRSLGCAGDVNRDGFSDIIIGTPFFDNGATVDVGGAWLYHGGSAGVTLAWTATGGAASDFFGYGVAGAGDVNGDGYSDVIVGAPLDEGGQSQEGVAFAFYGSSTGVSATADWTAEPTDTASAEWGHSVDTAGDVNGDGFSDVVIGCGPGGGQRVDVYFGSATGLAAASGWNTSDAQSGSSFGASVAGAGDVNGDGFCDIVVGAPDRDQGAQTNDGQATWFHGSGVVGIAAPVRQVRPSNGAILVAPPLLTGTSGSASFDYFARTPYGRIDVRLQVEIKAAATAFDATGFTNGAAFTQIARTGTTVTAAATGLTSSTNYKWRSRLTYRLSSGARQPFGPWRFLPHNGATERDFRPSN